MLINLIFLLILLSGSVFCAARFQLRTENTISITVMTVVLILLVFGVIGQLLLGIFFLLLASAVLYIIALLFLIKRTDIENWKIFCRNFFTCGLAVFLGMFFLISVFNRDRIAGGWDEFSHWVDVVKAMVQVDDFGTNPQAFSEFGSYPPGMALFQYFLQKIQNLIYEEALFEEWRVYVAYQVFFVAISMPIFDGTTIREPMKLTLLISVVFLMPLVFYPQLYSSAYIDPALGLLSGGGMALVYMRKKMNWETHLHICMLCGMLAMLKDAGMFLAIFLAIAYTIRIMMTDFKVSRKTILWAVVAFVFPLVLKLLWKLEVQTSGVAVPFSGRVDIVNLIQTMLGRGEPWRRTVMINFMNELTTRILVIGPLKLNYLKIILFSGIVSVLYLQIQKNRGCPDTWRKYILAVAFLQVLAYFVGLCIMYMYKFSEYEALLLASMERYVKIVLLSQWMLLTLIGVDLASKSMENSDIRQGLVLMSILLCIPMDGLYHMMRGNIVTGIKAREKYTELTEQIQTECENSMIYVVSQENNGIDFWILRFLCRPNRVYTENYGDWSLGEPFYEGDIWTKNVSVYDLQKKLLSTYNYVALFDLNDYFYEHYDDLFANPEDIAENRLYLVNKSTGLLEWCVP